MSLAACADLVARADPERMRAIMAAPVAARQVLFPIYAFNVEIARAPWVTQEPMIAEMRLQWWRDMLEEVAGGGPVRRHEVATPLSEILTPDMARVLDAAVVARRWDIARDPFDDAAHLTAYLEATGAGMLRASAILLGAPDDPVLGDFGYAGAAAQWLRAVPELEARGRIPLLDGRPQGIAAFAREALARLRRARAGAGRLPAAARPALLPLWQAGTVLKRAEMQPGRVAAGRLAPGHLSSSLQLAWSAISGRV